MKILGVFHSLNLENNRIRKKQKQINKVRTEKRKCVHTYIKCKKIWKSLAHIEMRKKKNKYANANANSLQEAEEDLAVA